MADLVLALATAGEVCGVALFRDGDLESERTVRHRMRLSERLIEYVDSVLTDGGAALADVGAIAVEIGPGSFTGVRIGVMTAKVWADLLTVPLYGVSTLEALGRRYAGIADAVVALVPGRPGLVFAQVDAGWGGNSAEPAAAPISCAPDEVPALLPTGIETAVLTGPGLTRLSAGTSERWPVRCLRGESDWPRAAEIGRAALRRRQAGKPADDPVALTPLYVAEPQISTPRKVAIPRSHPGA